MVQRTAYHARVVVRRHHHHRDRGELRADRRQAGEPVVAGHVQVQQHQIDVIVRFQRGDHAIQ